MASTKTILTTYITRQQTPLDSNMKRKSAEMLKTELMPPSLMDKTGRMGLQLKGKINKI